MHFEESSLQSIKEVIMDSSCDVCGLPSTSRCGSCKKVFYCSKVHQKIGWKTHKISCQGSDRAGVGSKIFDESLFDSIEANRVASSFERAKGGKPDICRGILLPNYIKMAAFAEEKSFALSQQAQQGGSYHTTDCAVEHAIMPALESLKVINIRQIADEVNKIHWDRVLYATVVEEPFKTASVHVMIQDVEGEIMRICLYSFPGDYTTLVSGTHIAVLAPYMKHSRDDPITVP